MRLRRSTYCFCLAWSFLATLVTALACAGARESEKAAPNSKPSLIVWFERQAIRENDKLRVILWLSNDSSEELRNVKLIIEAPQQLEWHQASCTGQPDTHQLDLGTLSPNSVRPISLCVETSSTVVVDSFTILFALQYEWQNGKTLRQGVVTVEKQLTVSLLGADNLAGIPFSLAGLIVPGLFFWIVIELMKRPWGVGLAIGEKLIYSVVVSLLFLYVSSHLNPMNLRMGISMKHLFSLAGAGAGVGSVVCCLDWFVRWKLRRKQEAWAILPGDPSELLLKKLLHRYSGYNRPLATVRLKNGESYSGSLAVQTSDTTIILGWFQLGLEDQTDHVKNQFRQALSGSSPWMVLELADRLKINVTLRNAVKKKIEGEENSTGYSVQKWANDEVSEWKVEKTGGQWSPLDIPE